MKRMSLRLVLIFLALFLFGCPPQPEKEPQEQAPATKKELTTFQEKSSYVGGLDIGDSLKGREADVDLPTLILGIEHAFQGQESLIPPDEVAQIKKEYAEKVRAERVEKSKAIAEKNSKEGEAFLAENGKKEGVVTTESGLQYMVLSEGGGPKPEASDQVRVHYAGTLIDGTEFDSSYTRGQPATFPLMRVIKGWTEGLQLMPVGSKYRFFIPADLAYGERGGGQKIGPNATLIFEVELLEIVEPPEGKTDSPTE
jgi:FKBP-type peptidyl-prolyl cis-trans isomerase FkpA/FKBP-type peptidyl-prolyl cis-trans isomerase FklB